MASYNRSSNALLLSNLSCFCDKCIRGLFDKCQKLPLRFSLKKIEYGQIIKLFESTQNTETVTQEPERSSENILNPQTDLGEIGEEDIDFSTDTELNSVELDTTSKSKQNNLKIRAHPNRLNEILVKFPHYRKFLESDLAINVSPDFVEDILTHYKTFFPSMKIVSPLDVNEISKVLDGLTETYGKNQTEQNQFLSEYFELENFTSETIVGMIYTSKNLSDNKKLWFDKNQLEKHERQHYVSFSLNITTGELVIFDTNYSMSDFHLVFEEKSLKNFFNRLLSVVSNRKFRSLRKFNYTRVALKQRGNESGFLSLIIILICGFVDRKYIESFVLKNYEVSLNRFKNVLMTILIDGTFDSTYVSF